MRKIILSLLMFLASCSFTWADGVTFEATVSANRLSLEDALQLTLTVTGVNDDLNPINLPDLDGFSAKYVGPSTSVSIINGNYHSEKSFVYNLFPNKVGHFQIPAISATFAGQTFTTKPIDVEVFANSAQVQAQNVAANAAADPNAAPTAESLKDKILIQVSVDRTQVYLNEGLPVQIKLLVNGVPVRDIQYPQFDKTGFLADDFDKPQQDSEVVNGVKYDTVSFRTTIYPDRLGDLSFGPVQIAGNILYKTGQSNPFGQDNGIFGNDVFNNFFDSYTTRPITVNSTPLILHVLPMPEENRPSDYSGAIGQFDFQASVAPSQVKVGDPLTLKMDIKGSGNFKSFKMPVFKADGFKAYEPQVKDAGGEKTAEEVIIPISPGIKEVPAVRFSYFDTSLKDYKTITRGPFAIQVTAPTPDQDFKAVGFADVSHEPATVVVNQFSVGKVLGEFLNFLKRIAHSLWFWVSMGSLFVLGVVFIGWRQFQERLQSDPAFARRLKAIKEARQSLKPAEGYIAAGKAKELYALLSKVLRDYLANKWHRSAAALNVQDILAQLKTSKLDEKTITQIKTFFEQADLVCFAGALPDAAQMKRDLLQIQQLIPTLERSL